MAEIPPFRPAQPPPARTRAVAAAGALLFLLAVAATGARASVLHGVDLSNFQNEFPCDNASVLIIRPHTVLDVQRAVASHATVMASGAGHSWNQPFFCAAPPANASAPARPPSGAAVIPTPGSSVNIALTTLRPLAIEVNASDSSVWVDAAVITADLLQFLADFVTEDAPAGWTLPAFPWFVFQTVGGAVATGSHGSSLAAGSLSSRQQLLALEVVAADGSLRRYTPEEEPFLFRALRVSVGRLGVITRLKMRIEREVPVRRTLTRLAPSAFLARMRELQAAARAAGPAALMTPNGTVAALPAWANDTEWFWVPQKYEFYQVAFSRADAPGAGAVSGFVPDNTTVFSRKGDMLALGELEFPATAVANLTAGATAGAQPVVVVPPGGPLNFTAGARLYARSAEGLRRLVAGEINAPLPAGGPPRPVDAAQGQPWAEPAPNRPSLFYAASNMAEGTNEITRIGIRDVAGNATVESTAAYIKQPNATLAQLRRTPYDQYEVSMPLAVVGDCFAAVLESAYGADIDGADAANRTVDKGFRTAPLIRLVGPDDGLLLYINLEDYIFYNSGRRPNARFRAIMAALTGDPRCTSSGPIRLHWGKAGWPDAGCWRGDEQYGINWCSFGCAARTLDPQGKFRDSAPDRWTWAGVDLERCCGPNGFDAQREGCACTVRHERPRDKCPPPPFYTSR
ncbi:L-gulonolactone oxidase [Raphidocelis subcapitata]|uniref:L-gulonolactone oxidase n=1 Tax=Raphidocelis subcapitata TaxID=307507 RepID=A0A2V0PHD2_9CHLO|nr:L-gulonolactone oxidase [Raphidocelis subcapitata]|eukprot:GBF99231.1 L-gulonolactone oxidase [Raphidocelis subcapitata]